MPSAQQSLAPVGTPSARCPRSKDLVSIPGARPAGTCGSSVYLVPPEGTMMQPKLPRCAQASGLLWGETAWERKAVPARGLPAGVQGQTPDSRAAPSPQDAPHHLGLIFCPFLSQSETNHYPESI